MSADPVSWLLIERGWPVRGRGGGELGEIDQVVADEQKDIFNGLVVRTGAFGTRYVPAERVAEIREDGVTLDLDADGLDALDESGPQDL